MLNVSCACLGLMIATPTAYGIYDYVRFQNQSIAIEGVITDAGCSTILVVSSLSSISKQAGEAVEYRVKWGGTYTITIDPESPHPELPELQG